MAEHELSWKDVWKVLTTPLKWAFSIAIALTGASIIGIIVTLVTIANKASAEVPALTSPPVITLVIFVGIALLGVGILAISSALALIRLKLNSNKLIENVSTLNSNCEKCVVASDVFSNASLGISEFVSGIGKLEAQVGKLSAEVVKVALSQYILNEGAITRLEESVIDGARIVVMTSKFNLDKGKLLGIILDNIRKGVVYEYLVPGEWDSKECIKGTDHRDFCQVIDGWWEKFKESLFNTKKENKDCIYCQAYEKLWADAKKAKTEEEKGDIIKQAWAYFAKHVKEYLIGSEHSLVTVIMYQQAKAPSDIWEVIIKLPTITDDNYYAFKIPSEEGREKTNLIDGVEKLCCNNVPLSERS
ncbi:hypothetical protein FACS1894211_06650 [Clostridia bacterium]|nr:hypothetical protein FACS1894211_06650 [Clostridia bacterium]